VFGVTFGRAAAWVFGLVLLFGAPTGLLIAAVLGGVVP
jgi:type IV secretory pathway VirB2 component (pilin)